MVKKIRKSRLTRLNSLAVLIVTIFIFTSGCLAYFHSCFDKQWQDVIKITVTPTLILFSTVILNSTIKLNEKNNEV